MAKKQTRRTVSLNRRVFERGTAYAKSRSASFSSLVEDLLLAAIGDAEFTAAVADHRAAEKLRTQKQETAEVTAPTGHGRGMHGCYACGGADHRAASDGLCAPSYIAARLVIDDGLSQREAAEECGVTQSSVSIVLGRLGKRSPTSRVAPAGFGVANPNAKSRLAAIDVLDGGLSQAESARQHGISPASVRLYVGVLRRERAASQVAA